MLTQIFPFIAVLLLLALISLQFWSLLEVLPICVTLQKTSDSSLLLDKIIPEILAVEFSLFKKTLISSLDLSLFKTFKFSSAFSSIWQLNEEVLIPLGILSYKLEKIRFEFFLIKTSFTVLFHDSTFWENSWKETFDPSLQTIII